MCCFLESCVLELRAGADDYDYDVQIVEDPIAAALVQKTSRKEKSTRGNCYAQSISRQNDWRHLKPIAASNILTAVAGRDGAKH